jgi:hypothetical protein
MSNKHTFVGLYTGKVRVRTTCIIRCPVVTSVVSSAPGSMDSCMVLLHPRRVVYHACFPGMAPLSFLGSTMFFRLLEKPHGMSTNTYAEEKRSRGGAGELFLTHFFRILFIHKQIDFSSFLASY